MFKPFIPDATFHISTGFISCLHQAKLITPITSHIQIKPQLNQIFFLLPVSPCSYSFLLVQSHVTYCATVLRRAAVHSVVWLNSRQSQPGVKRQHNNWEKLSSVVFCFVFFVLLPMWNPVLIKKKLPLLPCAHTAVSGGRVYVCLWGGRSPTASVRAVEDWFHASVALCLAGVCVRVCVCACWGIKCFALIRWPTPFCSTPLRLLQT